MNKHESYVEHDGLKNATHLQVSVYYSKDGINFLTGEATPRGFYLSVRPVSKGNGTIRFDLFSGQSIFLFGVSRFTSKQFDQAVAMAEELKEDLIAAVVAANQAA